MSRITGSGARDLRRRNGWSLQMLANLSGINKAYLSEFENGLRTLPEGEAERLAGLLEQGKPAGQARARLVEIEGATRLEFVDEQGNLIIRPRLAIVEWTEEDGSTYRMFVGERD